MFYSQFILAKKGPLGTIWIAAHLERKLRKNQVADTDIGVSVDSILFPDVPIALRLSSHLLLGVVRIYSRKVNYLFDDCSEALLKIKQAFRSTAVDLPPEESTAPYHSITLPETFDLDDFELPDSDIFQGNYVDHHISSRDQITLQDTMDGVVYSTSQFGLDERFGDGDASGLDLDEELLLDKIAAVGEAGLILGSNDGLQASVRPMSPGDANQIEGGDEDTDFAEYAQAPCTPGLMEEPNLSTVQETSACDDHMETYNHNTAEFSVKENLENGSSKSELLQQEKQNGVDWSLVNEQNNPDTFPPAPADKNGYHSDDLESCQIKQPLNDVNTDDNNIPAGDNDDLESTLLKQQQLEKSPLTMDHQISLENNPYSPSSSSADQVRRRASADVILAASDDGPDRVAEVLVNGTTVSNEHSVEEKVNEDCQGIITLGESTTPGGQEEKPSDESNRESDDRLDDGKLEPQVCQQSKDSEIVMKCGDPHLLLPCTTTTCLNQSSPFNPGGIVDPDLPFEELSGLCSKDSFARDEALHVPGGVVGATDISKQVEENHNTRPPDSCEDIQERSGRSNDQVEQFLGDDFQLGNINSSIFSDFPAPEKLLSVPEGYPDVQNNFLEEATPDKEAVMGFDRAGAVSESVSGKKRSFTESSLTVQSLYSSESLGVLHTKGTVESVPDDNDLLSSILVGRRSSVLKVKPTPTETKSMKRSRSAPRTSSSKRKVLMDDSMVLHGDLIRQQLTSTEDIRRVRKKAPCTRPEISMIQRQFLEDEIFSEPILTGESTELASLQNQTYDMSEIRISQCDVNDASFEVTADLKLISLSEGIAVEAVNYTDLSFQVDATKESGIDGSSEPMMVRDEAPQVQFADTLILTENERFEDQTLSSEFYSAQMQMNICTSDVPEAKRSSAHESCLGESAEMENNGKCISDVTAVTPDAAVASFDRNGEADATFLHIEFEASNTLKGIDDGIDAFEKIGDTEAAGENDDRIAGADKIDAHVEAAGKNGDEIDVVVDIESRAKDELEGTDGGSSVELIRPDIQLVSNPCATYSPEIVTTNQAMMEEEEIRKIYQEQIVNEEDTILDAQGNEYNAKGSVSNGIWGEQDSSNMMDLRNTYDGENPEAYPPLVTEAEVSATELLHLDDDFDYSTAGHDTEFLNVDDDEEADVDGDIMPSAEETRFLENSGWSSRTRAVANYLQTLFEKEAERGRKVLPVDNLLAGKTRKEASRMFFEALVLKTKDYVHVEQMTPFDNINIYPRHKLLKSDF